LVGTKTEICCVRTGDDHSFIEDIEIIQEWCPLEIEMKKIPLNRLRDGKNLMEKLKQNINH